MMSQLSAKRISIWMFGPLWKMLQRHNQNPMYRLSHISSKNARENHQKNEDHFYQKRTFLQTLSKDFHVHQSSPVLSKRTSLGFRMAKNYLSFELNPVLNCCASLRHFCSDRPYDPKKDAYMQDILKEFGRDFSTDGAKKSYEEDVTGSEVDSGYESDSDTTLDKSADTSSTSSESDSDSDLSSTDSDSSSERDQILEESNLGNVAEVHDDEVKVVVDEAEAEYEEIELYSDEEEEFEEIYERVHVVPLKRGKTGVFNIDELVAVLNDENALDLCVMEVPRHFNYVDFMVVASGRSWRHVQAMAEYVKWLHKRKKGKKDQSLKIEGHDSKDWIAMDLGNIAVHLFMPAAREIYDLEGLWALGGQYDNQAKQEDNNFSFLFDQNAAPEYNMDWNQAQGTNFSSGSGHQVAEDGSEDSSGMHSDQWHQVNAVNFKNKNETR